MSEEDLQKALEKGEEDPNPEPDPTPEPDPPPEPEPFTEEQWREAQEETARANGWKPLEEFIQEGGDPKKWVSAEVFNVKGDFIGQLMQKDREREREIQDRVKGVEKLYQARLNELKAQRKQAVESGDTQEFERLEKEIDDLTTPEQHVNPAQDQNQAVMEEWNQKNPWIYDTSPKSAYAKQVFAEKTSAGMSPAEALRVVDNEIARHYPPENEKPGSVPGSEKGKGARGFKSKSKSLTMDDLTDEEKNLWKNMSSAWKNDESKFLKAVEDARKAEEK